MKKYLVISGSGPDRVGLVDAISGFISAKKLNIEDSRMAVLGGDFALILLVSGDEAGIGRLKENLSELKSKTGLSLTVRVSSAPEARQVESRAALSHVGFGNGLSGHREAVHQHPAQRGR